MSYLVDSDRVTDWLRGRDDTVELLAGLRSQGIAISIITYGEIYEGIYYGRNPARNEREFRRFLRTARTLPLTLPVMRRFARIRGDLRARGQLIPDNDLMIAATAIEHGLVLVTRNVADFDRVPGLAVPTT